jgi:hypothetical protein
MSRNERDDRTIDEWQQGVPHPDDRRPPEEETPSLPSEGMQEDADLEAETVQGEEQPKRLLKSGVDPAEAARLRWAKAREREAAQEEEAAALSSGKVLLTRTPVHVGDIIARLNTKAKTGDVQAARELREWMREYPADDETDLSALDARTRQQVLARVLADIAEEEGEAPAGPVG